MQIAFESGTVGFVVPTKITTKMADDKRVLFFFYNNFPELKNRCFYGNTSQKKMAARSF
jgi:hypothetical protein